MNIRPLLAALAAMAVSLPVYAVDTPSSSVQPVAREPSARERMASARKFIDAKDWTRAMGELEAVLDRDPDNADAHNLMGYSLRKRANPDLPKAIEHYLIALKIDPKHKGAHEYIGEAYLQDHKPAEAEKHLVALEQICGSRTCEEYQDLARSIAEYKAKN